MGEDSHRIDMRGNAHTFALLVSLESGLGFLALLVAWLTDVSFRPRLEFSSEDLLRGAIACVPMLVALLLALQSRWQPLANLTGLARQLVRELFAESSWVELAVISLAAGLGEELLFRGALQQWLGGLIGVWGGVVLTSLLFGLAHAMSIAYFVVATIIGLYLGWLTEAYDDLIAPIVAHALYDFVAILMLRENGSTRSDDEETTLLD